MAPPPSPWMRRVSSTPMTWTAWRSWWSGRLWPPGGTPAAESRSYYLSLSPLAFVRAALRSTRRSPVFCYARASVYPGQFLSSGSRHNSSPPPPSSVSRGSTPISLPQAVTKPPSQSVASSSFPSETRGSGFTSRILLARLTNPEVFRVITISQTYS
jgi:hypothetical protein